MPDTPAPAPVHEPHIRGHDAREIRQDRHSASPKSHCNPNSSQKKSGGGGKYTWGSVLDSSEGPFFVDKNDPNFVSDEENVSPSNQ
jgi:hypothetical protein